MTHHTANGKGGGGGGRLSEPPATTAPPPIISPPHPHDALNRIAAWLMRFLSLLSRPMPQYSVHMSVDMMSLSPTRGPRNSGSR